MTDEDWVQWPAPIAVQRIGHHLAGIGAGEPRESYLIGKIGVAPPASVVRLLACAQREAAMGQPAGHHIVEAFARALSSDLLSPRQRQNLSEKAEELLEPAIAKMVMDTPLFGLTQKPPRGSLADEGETLGRRRSLARSATGLMLDKILLDPDPDVIKNAMNNPRMNEVLVMRLVARRTQHAPIFRVVLQSRFGDRGGVRRAIAMNPRCPPGLAIRLLSSLPRPEILAIAHDGNLDESVRAAARTLLESKPPKLPPQ